MSEPLYKLSQELAIINNTIEDGELSEELEKRLDETALTLKEKALGLGNWILNIDGKVDAIQAEIDRLKLRQQYAKNLKERLQSYIKCCMEIANIQKLESPTLTLAIQKNPSSVAITDESIIPAEYITLIETKQINKSQILHDLKLNIDIPGTRLENTKTHLRIK